LEVHVDQLRRLILDSIHEGVFTVDRDFRVTSFNAEAERITGLPRADALGRKCHEVFRASVCQSGCALRRTLESGRPLKNVRIDVLNADMEVVPISVSTAVLRDRKGGLLGGVEIFRDLSDIEALRSELAGAVGPEDLIGDSPSMREVLRILPEVASSEASVLVSGPSGSGKELVARALHRLSARNARPFVQVNCGALPDTLLESELFGYVKGAFTDARHDKPGRFVLAHRGTLFLDEVGELSPAFQVKLLRVLEDGEVQPLGATSSRKVDVRIIAATNRDLARRVREGLFRDDLFYRLRVVEIHLPPLARRPADITLLAEHFVRRTARRTGKPIERMSPAALCALQAYSFPGNVRELRNIVERAFVFCPGAVIEVSHLPPEVTENRPPERPTEGAGATEASGRQTASSDVDRPGTCDPRDAGRLLAALERHRWNRTATARSLGIGRNTLWRWIRRSGLAQQKG
jgi:PAS domain S-box-containing protein